MKQRKSRTPIEGGRLCPKCFKPMQRFEHPPGWVPNKPKAYTFRWWDVCEPCGHIQHYEEAKVWRT